MNAEELKENIRRELPALLRDIVISPMIDGCARKLGERLGVEMYGDSLDAPCE